MTTPPAVTDHDRDLALDRIRHRHRDDDNNRVHLLHSDDLLDVFTYLRAIGSRGLLDGSDDPDDGRHDIEDALVLERWLWWQAERAEMWLLEASEKLGLNRRRIGAVLGLGTGQGLVDRLDRKRGMFGPERVPSEKLVRAARRDQPAPAADERRRAGDLVDDAALRALLGALIANLGGVPDEVAEDVLALRRETGGRAELRPDEFVSALRVAVDDLRGAALPTAGQEALDRILSTLRM